MEKPVIGLAAAENPKLLPGKHIVNTTYVSAIIAAGGTPLLIPVDPDASRVQEYIPLLDGLLVPGGEDVSPLLYGQDPAPQVTYINADKDNMELALIQQAAERKLPVFGICRGMQMIQLYFKGELQPHFDVLHHQRDHVHRIHLSSRSWLHALMAPDAEVNSFHHQRIVTPQAQLRVDATAEDGTIESFHHEDLPVYGVQWHPELMHDDRILPYFVSLICGFV